MNPRLTARYLVASIVLLVALVAVYVTTSARRTQDALRAQLTERGLALAEAFEVSSAHAIRSNALLEEMIATRLTDNARLVDTLLRRPLEPGALDALAKRNGLRRIDLLDTDGRPCGAAACSARASTETPNQRTATPHQPSVTYREPKAALPEANPPPRLPSETPHQPSTTPREANATARQPTEVSDQVSGTPEAGSSPEGSFGPPRMRGPGWMMRQRLAGGEPLAPHAATSAAPETMAGEAATATRNAATVPQHMRFMWGRRWSRPAEPAEPVEPPVPMAPPAIRDRRFWEGTVFGVAVGATSFPGIIAVHADADAVVGFRRAIGVERQLEDLGRQSGVKAVELLGPDLSVLARSEGAERDVARDAPGLADAVAARRTTSRLVVRAPGETVLEVIRPIALDGGRVGALAVDLSTEPMERAWRRDLAAGLWLGGGVLAVGAVGMGLIFWAQRRQLREARAVEAETSRRERLAALGDVAAAFAHEVRNPLNAVSMGLQRLGADFRPEPAHDYGRVVGLMQGEVRRLNAIVEQFIALARPLPLKPTRVVVDDLLEELAALVDGEARTAGVTVRRDVAAALPPLVADRDHLKQVLLNLALNALQAMSGGGAPGSSGGGAPHGREGTLTLGAETSRGRMRLTVADTGPGIAPDVLPRVFDPYFTTRRGGLGLGLTIARRIVEAHGGTLGVASGPGAGTRFTVTLPVSPP